ncbi:vitamin K epoxide reductase family protein [Aeropyrum camini]|uniref:Predicted membrane protein n=1 Tax=Aeropyrum camini SY1 = JCM 12091 TaxID=1198449 RepID=U3TGT9_9CREN|nr:vitamin K epoxide reductase family protein [Aeropyrum camini]BAN90554.1 predicted membrane protein [Aeropyrum camini SY1 = JCM 12091]
MVDADPLNIVYLALLTVGWLASIGGFIEFRRSLMGGGFVCKAENKGWISCRSAYVIPQAFIAGRIHLSELAPIYFTATLAAALLGVLLDIGLLLGISQLLTAAGAAAVPYLVYLEVRVARAICLWCTVMHISLILALAAAAAEVLGG